MFRLLEISDSVRSLSLHCGKVKLTDWNEQILEIPLADIQTVIITGQRLSLTCRTLSAFAENGIPVVFCGSNYMPNGIFFPLESDKQKHREMLRSQLSLSEFQKKRLWKKIVQRKIESQAQVLASFRNDNSMMSFAEKVKNGDSENREAYSASLYWKKLALFPQRERFAADANVFFNYLYSVLYSAAARYISALGLSADIGIFHHNKYNDFCLASDLMEPFRPYADFVIIRNFAKLSVDEDYRIFSESRNLLLQDLYGFPVYMDKMRHNIFSAMQKTVFSFRNVILEKDPAKLQLPDVISCGF